MSCTRSQSVADCPLEIALVTVKEMGGPDAVAMTVPINRPRGEFLGVVTTWVKIPGWTTS